MKKIRLQGIPKRNEAIRWREFGTDGILLNPGSGDYFEVSETGLMIWMHVDGRRTVEEIIRELAARFDTDPEDLSRDTVEFMEELTDRGLVSIEPGPEGGRDTYPS